MLKSPFLNAFVEALPQKGFVYDMGAGSMRVSQLLIDEGLNVVAIDKKELPKTETPVPYRQDWIQSFDYTQTANGFLFKNSLQFVNKQIVFEKILPSILPGTVVAIETFTANPEPDFKTPVTSLYEQADFSLPEFVCLFANTFEIVKPGLDGVERKFSMLQIILKRVM